MSYELQKRGIRLMVCSCPLLLFNQSLNKNTLRVSTWGQKHHAHSLNSPFFRWMLWHAEFLHSWCYCPHRAPQLIYWKSSRAPVLSSLRRTGRQSGLEEMSKQPLPKQSWVWDKLLSYASWLVMTLLDM